MSTNLLGAVTAAREKTTNVYFLELRFVAQVLGTQPASENLIRQWLESKEIPEEIIKAHVERMREGMTEEEIVAAAEAAIEKKTEGTRTSFFHDAHGPWIGAYQLKACIREMLTTLGTTVAKRGSKQTYQHLLEVRACDPDGTPREGEQGLRLHLYRDDGSGMRMVQAVDGYVTSTARVHTPQGDRSVIKQHDYVEHGTCYALLSFPARMPDARKTAALTDEDIVKVIAHAGNNALGCSRSQGYGKFDVTRFERLTDNPVVLGKKGKKAAGASASA